MRDNPARALWRRAKVRAARGGLPFTITVADIEAVWPTNNRCPVFGTELVQKKGKGAGRGSPSLDRLNNDWGYAQGNIAVISMAANQIKGDNTAAEVLRVARWMKKQGLN